MVKKIFTYLILPVVIIGLVYAIVQSVMQPVRFNKEKAAREAVAIERLKDIRTLQVAFKSETGHFTSSVDSLKDFYNNGKIEVLMQIGSQDDSVAVENTKRLKKRNPRIKPEDMFDTLFNGRPGFSVDSLAFIPFSGDSLIMESTIKKVSGVNVPLFEASMPYRSLLKGLDNQLRINLDAEREDTGRYPGLKVGSVTAPNNNAGNWE